MREAYRRVRKDAAAGVDGVTAAQYEAELGEQAHAFSGDPGLIGSD